MKKSIFVAALKSDISIMRFRGMPLNKVIVVFSNLPVRTWTTIYVRGPHLAFLVGVSGVTNFSKNTSLKL